MNTISFREKAANSNSWSKFGPVYNAREMNTYLTHFHA